MNRGHTLSQRTNGPRAEDRNCFARRHIAPAAAMNPCKHRVKPELSLRCRTQVRQPVP